jgi:hypothetical protein
VPEAALKAGFGEGGFDAASGVKDKRHMITNGCISRADCIVFQNQKFFRTFAVKRDINLQAHLRIKRDFGLK